MANNGTAYHILALMCVCRLGLVISFAMYLECDNRVRHGKGSNWRW